MRHRLQVTCPLCGKQFTLEIDVGTYLSVETTTPARRREIPLVLRGREVKVDFIRRAMRALASKDPSGMVEISEVVEIAEKVGLSKEEVGEILKSEKEAGVIYEPKPGILSFTSPPEKSESR